MTAVAGIGAAPLEHSSRRSLAARVEERLLIPSYASRWSFASVFLHRALSLPFQLVGQAHRRTVHFGGERVEVWSVGRAKRIEALCTRLLSQLPESRCEGLRLALSPESLRRAGADLMVVEVHRWLAASFRKAGWLIVPHSVRWYGDVESVPPAQPSKSLRANLAKVRKHQFTLSQGASPADWEEFYTTMVQPQARARHGESAWIASRPFLERIAERGTLHLISENGVRVAGACTVAHGDTLWFPLLGVKQGDPQLLQRGASVATLALPLEWARANGYRRLDLGRTGPFVNDGLQEYKRKWGFAPVPDPLAHLSAVWIGSAEVREAFSREPVLVEDGTGLTVYAGQTP